jgi:hypothetical protein
MNASTPDTVVEPRWKLYLKGTQWSGRFAAFFAIAFFITALGFRSTGGRVVGWFATVTAWCMMLAIFSGVVCLVPAGFGFALGQRKNTTADRDNVHDANSAP